MEVSIREYGYGGFLECPVMRDGRVRRMFPQSGAVFLEVGCGAGYSLDEVSSCYDTTVGMDVSTIRLDERGTPLSNWKFVMGDLNRGLPFKSSSVDGILANQVIEHVADPCFFVGEILRVLRPEGVVVVTTPNIRYIHHILRLVVQGKGPKTANDDIRDGVWDDGHLHYFTHRDLRDVFSGFEFRMVESRALVNLNGRLPAVRQFFNRFSGSFFVREFFSGNAMLVAKK
ncbi:MAG: hypothetical protein COW19_02535 [Zetaproteobacteria bacterium CG12_big_fil_rev_8_21_14_0_65_55_1124]|nr:MAG: hypothetical protein AUJ58_08490 [Zetaproteobacteria bacterium CG1_02_55_237]PIS19702.1 MAG: hypothetical protein COT53_04040 [Zetaproteobacteria bacterium CG08_land_8_20_14_0_20_55_17]PIW43469.1 MAG: hypothetical protein COW19_02535 [Zetaproteobacteria bacterium CG12_big_fil_rev_8_21_14_0_65_55_1124]PIY54100.1 MAG: hypothetical protein COZ01_01315 [Zetaproteobacteria bacterium CG_4_10_14_0_8_um_filter_55_43]PIZ39093.1 MAG: hypothetical protein COY36_03795 [Zetaproteobacteria bacterium 